MKQMVVIALGTLGLTLGCGDQTDLRVTGANRAAAALTNLRGLWDSLQGGATPNATNAQNAVIELARLPGGLAAMLLRPIDLPTTGGTARTLAAAASFPECAPITNANGCENADFSGGCSAGPVTLTGSGRRCEAATCAGGKVYNGTLNVVVGGGGVSGNLGVQLRDLCVTPTSAAGGLTVTVQLDIPNIAPSNFTITATIVSLRFENNVPVAGSINVEGAGTFVGGPLAGCVTVEWSGKNVNLRRVSNTSCTAS